MEKEEMLLGVEMGRLEIEPIKVNDRSGENPFINVLQKRKFLKSPVIPKDCKCLCSTLRKAKQSAISKKKHNKILKQPILKILKDCGNNHIVLESKECQEHSSENVSDIVSCDPLSLCTLVQNCNQLTISSNASGQSVVTNENMWWKSEVLSPQESKEPKAQSPQAGSCSQQALNPPCDVTIDELASYFETLVHIPKKMSSMAEMMYI